MSVLIDGVVPPSFTYSRALSRSFISAVFASRFPPAVNSVYLITVHVGRLGPHSVTLRCDISLDDQHPLMLSLDWSAYLHDSLIASGFRLPASFDSFDVLTDFGPPEPYPLPSFRPPALNPTSGPSNTTTHSQSAVQMHGPSANVVRPDYLSRNHGGSPLIVPPTEITVSSKRNLVVISPIVRYVERQTASSSAPSLPISVILDPLDLPQAFDSTALITIFLSPRLSENIVKSATLLAAPCSSFSLRIFASFSAY
ncbi:hypothetical protein C8R44DRAFT_736547 [Mycena epipterygia]|nr:hypothetical protein C8R44DRAFT_736547 [Mycena epipterygia]